MVVKAVCVCVCCDVFPAAVCLIGMQPFKGFMMQAQDAVSGEALGSWQVDADIPASTMTCSISVRVSYIPL